MSAELTQRYRRALEGLLGVPATEGNVVEVLRNGDQIFPAMLTAIREAESTVDFATYVYWTGDIAVEFAQALCERAGAGVRVRVLLDAVGAQSMNRDLVAQMEQSGVQFEFFRPPTTWKVWETNHRTHRKVLICDEEVAFTGGVGIAEEWTGDAQDPEHWRETHVRLRGPAVDGLRSAFVSNWAETGRELFDEYDRFPEQPQPGGCTVQVVQSAAQFGWSDLATVMAAMIGLAKDTLRITSAYFVPDERFVAYLTHAAARGVDVQVLMPGEHADKRVVQVAGEANYDELLEAGVRIFRYDRTMLHAKIVTADGVVATVGSGNFDQRSLGINEEANIVVFDRGTTEILDQQFADDLQHATEVHPGDWKNRGPVQRVAEAVTNPISPQL
ncbi:MAG TPA: phospholipase D-like domain-containing protein [Egibacteraceae bacterium]|nr:phospholipase D-like domain-containing protein [Egibacteraceae bacterium]